MAHASRLLQPPPKTRHPTTQTASLFGSVGAGTSKWMGGALGPNGDIYCIPYDSTQVLEIDPITSGTKYCYTDFYSIEKLEEA